MAGERSANPGGATKSNLDCTPAVGGCGPDTQVQGRGLFRATVFLLRLKQNRKAKA